MDDLLNAVIAELQVIREKNRRDWKYRRMAMLGVGRSRKSKTRLNYEIRTKRARQLREILGAGN